MARVTTPGVTSVRLDSKFEGWCDGMSESVSWCMYMCVCVCALVFSGRLAVSMSGCCIGMS